MSDIIQGAMNQSIEYEFEPCFEINQGEEQAEPRAGFNGLLQDAPGCSTAVVNGLSQQLIHQMNLVLPNALVSFDDLNVDLGDAAFPFVQPQAKQGLQQAIKARGAKMYVNSAYRTIAQQLLLHRWGSGCGYSVVAQPGQSNHQSGLAIDIEDPAGWQPYLEQCGWRWYGPGDPPHFDYVGGGCRDLRGTAMLALQRLWNKNYPNRAIAEDGVYGAQTEDALNQAPALGFAKAPWDEAPRMLRLSRPPMEGKDVQKLQEKLKAAGMTIGIDGVFGPGTDKAVKAFQQQKQLTADGVVGPRTMAFFA